MDPTTMALPLPEVGNEPNAYALAAKRIRRCTYRRMSAVPVPGDRVFEVACLYPDRRQAIPLGDLDTATPICNACTAAHIFRPDED
jgi:hypothetical protein